MVGLPPPAVGRHPPILPQRWRQAALRGEVIRLMSSGPENRSYSIAFLHMSMHFRTSAQHGKVTCPLFSLRSPADCAPDAAAGLEALEGLPLWEARGLPAYMQARPRIESLNQRPHDACLQGRGEGWCRGW